MKKQNKVNPGRLDTVVKPVFLNIGIDPIRADRFIEINYQGFIAGNTEEKQGFFFIKFRNRAEFEKYVEAARSALDNVLV